MSRSQEHEIEIRAPVEAVWRALVDPEELIRWFVEEARVEPGAGGRVSVSWGEGMEVETQIAVWEPPARLRLLGTFGGALEEPMVEEYVLETRGGATVLRFVHGGIPDSPDWDGMFESTKRGWGLFLGNLRHYLEQHPGEPRTSRYTMTPVQGTAPDAWRAVLDALGLDAEPAEGSRYAGTTRDGDRIEGDVVAAAGGSALQLTLDTLDRALLTLSLESSGDALSAWFTVASFGEGETGAADRLAAGLLDALAGGA
jgi:uncharacterized protein YndB with AHSA1/START domain